MEPDFDLNEREIEPFEPPKILGDVFESVMGAIFEDGGMNEVVKVYKHLISPLLLFCAKFTKKCYGEAKEQFILLGHLEYKVSPQFAFSE